MGKKFLFVILIIYQFAKKREFKKIYDNRVYYLLSNRIFELGSFTLTQKILPK